ncbi:hypothetical protein MN608_04238 [Microdochium nivale]|nr:hypothetical protein MN608_04238 [Microdochium nivale]
MSRGCSLATADGPVPACADGCWVFCGVRDPNENTPQCRQHHGLPCSSPGSDQRILAAYAVQPPGYWEGRSALNDDDDLISLGRWLRKWDRSPGGDARRLMRLEAQEPLA